MGNLGSEVDLRYSQDGRPRARISLATRHARKQDDGTWEELTDWHKVVVFGPQAEHCANHLTKGSGVLVEGRLTHRSWEDDNNVKRWITEVIAREVLFLPRPAQREGAPPLAPTAQPSEALDADVPF